MPHVKVCVLRAPGTNCDVETAYAFRLCGAAAERVHLFRLLDGSQRLDDYQILCIPGGFSYGDDIGAGVIFSRKLRLRLGEQIARFLKADKLILGICNGFQVLLKSGILPAGAEGWQPDELLQPQATLTWNNSGKYTAIWVRLAVDARNSVFLRGIDEIELPVAHAEGKVVVRDDALIDRWHAGGQIALRYCRAGQTEQHPCLLTTGQASEAAPAGDPTGSKDRHSDRSPAVEPVLPYPYNPNGSVANIAGLSDPSGRVLGLMPHPERFIFATQHPQWTRRGLQGEGKGLAIFRNAVEYFG